jgi:hypothetical protein
MRLLNEWKVTGARIFASGKNADGSGISLPAARVKFTSTKCLTLVSDNAELAFDLSAATFGKSEGIPEHLVKTLITSVSISFPSGARLALCELVG